MKHPRWFMLGERNPSAVLTRRAIRRLRPRRNFPRASSLFNVAHSTAHRAVTGRTWGRFS
jgi:hypothetical protein